MTCYDVINKTILQHQNQGLKTSEPTRTNNDLLDIFLNTLLYCQKYDMIMSYHPHLVMFLTAVFWIFLL